MEHPEDADHNEIPQQKSLDMDKRIGMLQEQCTALLNALQSEKQMASSQRQTLDATITDLRWREAKLIRTAKEQEQSIKRLQANLAKLQAQNQQLSAQTEEQSSQIEALHVEVNNLRQGLDTKGTNLTAAVSAGERLQTQLVEYQKRLKMMEADESRLRDKLKRVSSEFSTASRKAEYLKQEDSKLRQENIFLRQMLWIESQGISKVAQAGGLRAVQHLIERELWNSRRSSAVSGASSVMEDRAQAASLLDLGSQGGAGRRRTSKESPGSPPQMGIRRSKTEASMLDRSVASTYSSPSLRPELNTAQSLRDIKRQEENVLLGPIPEKMYRNSQIVFTASLSDLHEKHKRLRRWMFGTDGNKTTSMDPAELGDYQWYTHLLLDLSNDQDALFSRQNIATCKTQGVQCSKLTEQKIEKPPEVKKTDAETSVECAYGSASIYEPLTVKTFVQKVTAKAQTMHEELAKEQGWGGGQSGTSNAAAPHGIAHMCWDVAQTYWDQFSDFTGRMDSLILEQKENIPRELDRELIWVDFLWEVVNFLNHVYADIVHQIKVKCREAKETTAQLLEHSGEDQQIARLQHAYHEHVGSARSLHHSTSQASVHTDHKNGLDHSTNSNLTKKSSSTQQDWKKLPSRGGSSYLLGRTLSADSFDDHKADSRKSLGQESDTSLFSQTRDGYLKSCLPGITKDAQPRKKCPRGVALEMDTSHDHKAQNDSSAGVPTSMSTGNSPKGSHVSLTYTRRRSNSFHDDLLTGYQYNSKQGGQNLPQSTPPPGPKKSYSRPQSASMEKDRSLRSDGSLTPQTLFQRNGVLIQLPSPQTKTRASSTPHRDMHPQAEAEAFANNNARQDYLTKADTPQRQAYKETTPSTKSNSRSHSDSSHPTMDEDKMKTDFKQHIEKRMKDALASYTPSKQMPSMSVPMTPLNMKMPKKVAMEWETPKQKKSGTTKARKYATHNSSSADQCANSAEFSPRPVRRNKAGQPVPVQQNRWHSSSNRSKNTTTNVNLSLGFDESGRGGTGVRRTSIHSIHGKNGSSASLSATNKSPQRPRPFSAHSSKKSPVPKSSTAFGRTFVR